MTQEVLKMALEALETSIAITMPKIALRNEAITALREALAEPHQEPVANDGWLQTGGLLYRLTDERHPQNRDEISVTMADGSRSIESRTRRAGELLDRIRSFPPQRKPLTDEEINQIADEFIVNYRIPAGSHYDFARAIEAAHGIKGEA